MVESLKESSLELGFINHMKIKHCTICHYFIQTFISKHTSPNSLATSSKFIYQNVDPLGNLTYNLH